MVSKFGASETLLFLLCSAISPRSLFLGACQIKGVMESGTLSGINENCAWAIASSVYTPSDAPSGMYNSVVITIKASKTQNPAFQLLFNGVTLMVRLRWFGDWADWKTVAIS